MKKSLISMLVLLMTAVSGAWAQEETLLTTILSTGDNASFKSGSKTFDNKATVTFSGTVRNDDDEVGWYSDEERTLTVTAAEKYTITRVKFYTDEGSGFDEEAPFEAILVNDGGIITKVNGTKIGIGGVTKIEVYGYADIVNHSANNTWAIAEMPAFNVELLVEYFNITVPTANTADIYAGRTTPLINAGSTTEEGATMKYLVTATNEQPTSTDGFSAAVPTAQGRTAGTYYVWYYLDFASGDDSDISALAVEVTVRVPIYHVTMKEGTLDADNWQGKAGTGEYQALPLTGLEAGTAVSVKYNGWKKVKSVKAKKKPTAEDKGKGKLICTDGHIHAYGEDAECTKARVAKIIYIDPTGHATYSHGLALALTDEGQMAWGAAIDACSAKNTSTPVTNATWLLASDAQWDYMLGADGAGSYTALRDGFSGITGASNLQSGDYWSSTESSSDNAWYYYFGEGHWYRGSKGDENHWVRACLAFGAQVSDPDPIDLTPSADGTVWTLSTMPDYDVELEVEYYVEVTLTMKEGTLDATNWQGKAGTGEYQALPFTGLEEGTAVTVKYNGTKKVKSVKAKKQPYTMAAAATSPEDKGKLICTSGHIHAYGEDAECTKARVAKIIYIGSTGHGTYNHGLALALTDEGVWTRWGATDACSAKNTSTPVTGATWLLASKDQWDKMITAAGSYTALRDGFSSVGGSNLQSGDYWSTTWYGNDAAWCYVFSNGHWGYNQSFNYCRARACLVF